jgi:hypothetical protein
MTWGAAHGFPSRRVLTAQQRVPGGHTHRRVHDGEKSVEEGQRITAGENRILVAGHLVYLLLYGDVQVELPAGPPPVHEEHGQLDPFTFSI